MCGRYQQQMAQLEGYVWVGALNAVHGWGLTIGDASRSYQVFLREDLARGVRPSPDPVMARWQRGEQIGWPIATP